MAQRTAPSVLDGEDWRRLLSEHLTVLGIAAHLHCSRNTVRRHLQAHGIEYEQRPLRAVDRQTPEPNFPDIKEFPGDAKQTWDEMIRWQKENRRWDISQQVATVEIPTELPVGIAIRGDWHLGNEQTDHERFLAHMDLIERTPGLYTIEAGDLIDGYIKPSMAEGQHEALARVRLQRHLVWDACERLKGRVLATASGQHDHWGVHQADFDPIEWVSADYRIPYLGHGGLLRLHAGKQEYTMHMRHKFRYESGTNRTHSIKQFWRFNGDSEIGCHADKHTPAIEHVLWKGEHRVAVRPGSYKPTDDFAESYGYPRAEPIMPVIILWPNEHRLSAEWTLEWGAEALGRWRAKLS